jgi:hypothetical protein
MNRKGLEGIDALHRRFESEGLMTILRLVRENGDIIYVLLLPHKDGSGWSYVNLTKKSYLSLRVS